MRRAFNRVRDEERTKRKADPDTLKQAAAVARGQVTKEPKDDAIRHAMVKWITEQRVLISSNILRRTTASKGPDGLPISSLPAITHRRMYCELRPDEQAVQERLATELVDGEVTVNQRGVKVSAHARTRSASMTRPGRRRDAEAQRVRERQLRSLWCAARG